MCFGLEERMKKLAAVLLAGTMVFSLAACGSSSSSTSTSAEADTGAAAATDAGAAEVAATEVAAGTSTEEGSTDYAALVAQSDALSDGVLTVGTNAAFPPFESIGEDGEPEGFDMALIKAIGDKMGVEVEIQDMEFDSLVASIGNKIDASIAGMTITPEREEAVTFSDPYYDATQVVIVPKDSDITSAADLEGKKIGSQLGTTGNSIADGIEGATSTPYNKGMDAVNDLLNGRLDCVIIDTNPAQVFVSQYPDQIQALSGDQFDFDTEQYGIAMSKDETAMREAVNAALADLKADGTYDELVEEYISSYDASDDASTGSTSSAE